MLDLQISISDVCIEAGQKHVASEYRLLTLDGDMEHQVQDVLCDIDSMLNDAAQVRTSGYTLQGMPSSSATGTKIRSLDPFMASIEGIFPIVSTETCHESTRRYHTQGNITVCELFISLLKWIYPPGVLQIVTDWMNSEMNNEARATLIKAMDDVHMVRQHILYTRKSRLQQNMPAAQEATMMQEILFCKPVAVTAQDCKRSQSFLRKDRGKRDRDFLPPSVGRITAMTEATELHYSHIGKTLAKGHNDAPFLFSGQDMPTDWYWWDVWVLFHDRLITMWLYCNGLFLQITDLTIKLGQPLRFPIGKVDPDRQMLARCKTQRPQSITDLKNK